MKFPNDTYARLKVNIVFYYNGQGSPGIVINKGTVCRVGSKISTRLYTVITGDYTAIVHITELEIL